MVPSYLQANCRVNCVPDSRHVYCGRVLKATWSGELSDKCAIVVFGLHVYYITVIVYINVDCETDDALEHLGSGIVLKFRR